MFKFKYHDPRFLNSPIYTARRSQYAKSWQGATVTRYCTVTIYNRFGEVIGRADTEKVESPYGKCYNLIIRDERRGFHTLGEALNYYLRNTNAR